MRELYSIFDEAQRVTASRNACSRKLKNIVEKAKGDKNTKEIFQALFLGCLDRVLPYTKTDPKVSRITSFFAESVSTFSIKNVTIALEYLLERSEATDKTVRARSCQIIGDILSLKLENSSNQCELSAELCEKIIDVLLPRLSDRFSNIRVQAVYALKSLQDSSDADDPLILEFLRIMNSDDSDEVRSAVLECIAILPTTLPSIVARVKDIHKNVRLSCLKRLSENVDMRHMHVKMRGMVIRHGLQDRDPSVKNAAVDLAFTWLKTHDYKVANMLKYLGLLKNEDEVEIAAYEIMENIEKRTDISTDIKKQIMLQSIDWQSNDLDSIAPSEFLWSQLRCAYAFKNPKSAMSINMISELVPDIVEVCRVLKSIPMSTLVSNANLLMSFRNLLKMSAFFDKSDLQGNKELASVCREMVLDTEVPSYLVERLLYTWKIATENTGHAGRSRYHQLMADSRKQFTSVTDTSNINEEGNADESTAEMMTGSGSDEVTTTIKKFRSLQIISWCLQQVIGGSKPAAAANTLDKADLRVYTEYVPFIFECLPCTDPEMRGLSIKCMGLLPLYSDSFCSHQDILLQVVNTDEEDDNTRCLALQALIDMATVYGDKFKDDSTLSNILFRLLNTGSGSLQRLAVEGAAKLLFCGCLSDSRLFANLIKFFFLPELSSDVVNTESGVDDTLATQRYQYLGNDDEDIADVGTQARLHQALSVFFHYFLIDVAAGREKTLLDSVSELVSDVCMHIRQDEVPLHSLTNIHNHLIGMSEKFTTKHTAPAVAATTTEGTAAAAVNTISVRHELQKRFAACMCREVLKLGKSKKDRLLAKEYVRLLSQQDLDAWLDRDSGTVIQTTFQVAEKSCDFTEKTVQKNIELIRAVCKKAIKSKPSVSDTDNVIGSSSLFADLAPGIVNLLGHTDDSDYSINVGTAGDANPDADVSMTETIGTRRTRRAAASKKPIIEESSDEEEDEEEEEEEEEEDERQEGGFLVDEEEDKDDDADGGGGGFIVEDSSEEEAPSVKPAKKKSKVNTSSKRKAR